MLRAHVAQRPSPFATSSASAITLDASCSKINLVHAICYQLTNNPNPTPHQPPKQYTAEMNKRGIKKPASPPKRQPPPSKLNFGGSTKPAENVSPQTANKAPPSPNKPIDPPLPADDANLNPTDGVVESDWDNLKNGKEGRKEKKKKKDKSRFKNKLDPKPELAPIKSKKSMKILPPVLQNKHAKIGLSDAPDSPDPVPVSTPSIPNATDSQTVKMANASDVNEDPMTSQRRESGNMISNAFMEAGMARFRKPKDFDPNLTVEEKLGMKDINGAVLEEDVEKAYTTNRFMPTKKAKRSEDYFDGSASYATDEDARLGRHFHRRRKQDKYGWWEGGEGNHSHQARMQVRS